MDSIPPSYMQATTRDHWTIISSFVRSQDLCSAALVSRRWNLTFMPHLWGNPASHFGTENDAVYVALVRFKRTLSWARLSTRELTHTLHLPPAHTDLYEGPKAEWLRDILHRLPRLQSLIVSGLPFFDHWALMNLRSQTPGDTWTPATLRLLEACQCLNATSNGLREGLSQFSSLTYLDLSRTPPARDPKVLEALKFLPKLQILKLRGLQLRDEDIELVSKTVGRRIRSLDVRDNRVTDLGVRFILQNCIMTVNQASKIVQTNMIESGSLPRSMAEYFGAEISEVYKSNLQDRFVYNRLTSGFFHHLGIEDTLRTGITHLYISGNDISVNAVADLLRIQRLHVLDVGSISMAFKEKSLFLTTRNVKVEAECLVPLVENNGEHLTYLRIHHSIVTNCLSPETPEIAELDGGIDVQLADETISGSIQELPGDEPVVSRLAPESHVFELEGSPVPSIRTESSPNTSNGQTQTLLSPESAIRPDNLVPRPLFNAPGRQTSESFEHLPEPINSTMADYIVSPLSPAFAAVPFSAFPSSPIQSRSSGSLSHPSSSIPHPSQSSSQPQQVPESLHVPERQQSHGRTYSGIMSNHENKVKLRKSQPHGLLPSMIPHVRTLVLTDFPNQSFTQDTASNFISFLSACAEEEAWSEMQSKLGYEFPPGTERNATDERLYAKSLFALNRVVLEISKQNPGMNLQKPGAYSMRSPSPRNSKSSVEDPDCEAFWSAASTDFSFFGRAGEEECGVPAMETMRAIPMEARLGKMVVGEAEQENMYSHAIEQPKNGPLDVLADISKFRRQKKVAYERAVLRGDTEIYVDGYWSGDITVMR